MGHFCLLNLDPDLDCESGYGSRDPIESGSNPDTDPQHWYYLLDVAVDRYRYLLLAWYGTGTSLLLI